MLTLRRAFMGLVLNRVTVELGSILHQMSLNTKEKDKSIAMIYTMQYIFSLVTISITTIDLFTYQ